MIILPTATPLALTDLNSSTQSRHQQIQLAEQSKKATDTVQVSAQAREMAGAGLRNHHSRTAPTAIQAANHEAAEKTADNEIAEQQRPRNPVTQQTESTKIDILA